MSSNSESPASGSCLDKISMTPPTITSFSLDALSMTPPTTTSFQSSPLVLPAPTVLPHPASPAFTVCYDLQSLNGYSLQDDSSISFFTSVPNVGLQSSNGYSLQEVSFTEDMADSSSSFLNDIPKETPPALHSFLSTSHLFPPALQLSPIAPHLFTHALHSLPSFQPSMATPQFTFLSLPSVTPAAPVVAEETLDERDATPLTSVIPAAPVVAEEMPDERDTTPHPSITPIAPMVAEDTPDDTADIAVALPEKALKVKCKCASKAINKATQAIDSNNTDTLRKTGHIWQESTHMAQANQIGQSNKRARTWR
ncbi:uncharacterized protein EDB91DRAFT_1256202 [Suillus paluster]|uniref:uncharacterized protein n=1 Tax=Suillus paluster TaxID=48578 RepID=UPI001B85DED4|nr:uncharacterized protein EDB91DRAFT_1256202 [Suillus paluster]KAG1722138.1 hypothetical protein EDB91DRAFT_1256202 [Suillus paluster]